METIIDFIQDKGTALLCLIVGLSLRLWVQRRRFYRRGVGGLQHYSSYSKALFTSFLEWMLIIISMLMIAEATLLFITK